MNSRELALIKQGRHKARTDLFWLSKYVLGLDRLSPSVHQPLINKLQQFPVQGKDEWVPNVGWTYTPVHADPFDDYPTSEKRRLLLAPRGWYKTSVNVIAHSVQWILNYPDITMLLVHASQEMAEDILASIKMAFQANSVMRYYFPEFCPPASKDWGTQGKFNIPTRKIFISTAATMEVSGIETIRTGKHYHIIKYTDLVDEKNSVNKEQCEKIIHRYGMSRNLLISGNYWIDIEGTRYNFSDLYGRIVDTWLERDKANEPQEFQCFTMGCYKTDLKGEPEDFTPDELESEFLLDPKGKFISRFPEQFPTDILERIRLDPITGGDMFATQQLNNPVALSSEIFSKDDLRWKSSEDIKKIPPMFHITTVDFAHTKGRRSDYTAITTCMIDRMNRRYVVEIKIGKWSAEESIDQLFATVMKYRPVKVKVEKSAFWSGLQPSIARKMQLTGFFPDFFELTRPTDRSKTDRIEATLQPWNAQKLLYFSSDIPEFVKNHLIHEWTRFPKYRHDDIMDTLADQFDGEHINLTIKPRKATVELHALAQKFVIENTARHNEIFGPVHTELSSWQGLGKI